MKRWILRGVGVAVLGYVAYLSYNTYRAGYLSLPDLPDGAYTVSFTNGLRAIVLDAEVTDRLAEDGPMVMRRLTSAVPDRRFLGVPFEVQPWFEDAWSWCKAPTAEEQADLERMPEDFQRTFENAHFEAVCRIDVDGTDLVRGLIFSVPNL